MNTFLIKEIFKIHGGISGLTEKVIYENQARYEEDNISVFSSATEKTYFLPKVDKNTKISGKHIKVFSKKKKYIIVARNGKAGQMGIIENLDFTITDHAYIFETKKNFITKIDLDYFILMYQNTFLEFVSSKDSNGTFSKEISENYEIKLISIEDQIKYISDYNKRKTIINQISTKINEIDHQLKKVVKLNKRSKKFLITELFLITSGVRITQKEIYNNSGGIPVVTSQTTNEGIAWYGNEKWLMSIEKNSKKVIVDRKCLTWTKDGAKCGTMFYRDYEFYPNDHCGVLIPKKPLNLQWIKLIMQSIVFGSVVAKNAQGMLYEEQMANVEVEIPITENGEIDIALQNEIYMEYKQLSDTKEKLEHIIKKYSS